MKTLVKVFDKYKCDKGSLRHRYDRAYEPTLKLIKNQKINLLEIGIFKGTSVQSWVDYLPNAHIFGIDIFVRTDPKDIKIFNHPRVHWCKCDSTVKPTTEFIEMINDEFESTLENKFDIIIDDGKHTHEAQRKTFENFFPFLKPGGVYFIEDVWPFDIMTSQQKQHKWLKLHPDDFSDEQYQKLLDVISPNDYEYHDLRAGHGPDTFIIKIRKNGI